MPDPDNPQSFNRYSYVLNSALNHTDPSGHCPDPVANGYEGSAEIICVAWFIPTTQSRVPFGPDYIGDARDFSMNSDEDASRAWAWIDANTGDLIRSEIHETCNTWGQCAGPIDDEGLYKNVIDPELQEDGSIKLTYSILCAGLRCAGAPGPDGEITFIRNDDGSFTSKGNINSFPNVEAYHFRDVNDPPDTLFRHRFVSQEELDADVTYFGTSTLGMLGVNQFEWDYSHKYKARIGGY